MALIVAVLYFGLIELMLYDASRELAEARRFRARIIALTLAENGAELAAHNLVTAQASSGSHSDWQGTISGTMSKPTEQFTIDGKGDAAGIVKAHAEVYVQGRVDEHGAIHVDYTRHTQ